MLFKKKPEGPGTVEIDGHHVPKDVYDKIRRGEDEGKHRETEAYRRALKKLQTRIESEIEYFEQQNGQNIVKEVNLGRNVTAKDFYGQKIRKPINIEVVVDLKNG